MHALTSARRWPFVRRGLGGRTAIQCSRLRQPIEQHVDVHEAGVRPCITGRCLIALGHIDPQPEQAIEQMPQAPPVDVGSRAWADRLDEQRAPSTNPFGGQSLPQRAERVPLPDRDRTTCAAPCWDRHPSARRGELRLRQAARPEAFDEEAPAVSARNPMVGAFQLDHACCLCRGVIPPLAVPRLACRRRPAGPLWRHPPFHR
jgi:hypothetical protein